MTNQYFMARFSGRDPNLRAADADRERVAERLRKSHAEGRLDMAEFQERLERCYESKTIGQLDTLVKDLPRPEETVERPSVGTFGSWSWRPAKLALLLIALLVIASSAGPHHFFWLWIPIVFIFWRMTWMRRRRWSGGVRRGPGPWI